VEIAVLLKDGANMAQNFTNPQTIFCVVKLTIYGSGTSAHYCTQSDVNEKKRKQQTKSVDSDVFNDVPKTLNSVGDLLLTNSLTVTHDTF